jgi:hypothetical protein
MRKDDFRGIAIIMITHPLLFQPGNLCRLAILFFPVMGRAGTSSLFSGRQGKAEQGNWGISRIFPGKGFLPLI